MKKKNLYLLIVIIVVTLAGATSAFTFLTKPDAANGRGKEVKAAENNVNFPLEPFIVNLISPVETKFAKMSIELELPKELEERAKARTPQIRDAILMLITSKSPESLKSPEGKLQFKDEISLGVNQVLGDNSVKNVYFTDLVMQ